VRILYLTQYFPPEIGATQSRAHDLAVALSRAGHRVQILCELPNHPSGRLPPRYRGCLWERDHLDGVDVLRTWVYTSEKKSRLRRMGLYMSFAVSSLFAALLLVRARWDAVIATSPPLFVGLVGVIVAKLKRAPLLFEVRDPWPQAAIELGELRSKPAIRFARWMESTCYRQAAQIVTVSDRWRREIDACQLAARPVALVRNGANLDLVGPQPVAAERVRRALGLEARFVVAYIGLHGLAQQLEQLIDAAALLRTHPSIVFLLVGEGPCKSALQSRVHELQLENVLFHQEVPRRRIAAFISAADVAAIPLSSASYARGCIPLKLYESWACGCPTILCADGEARDLLNREGAGLAVDPGDSEALAAAVLRLQRDPQRRRAMAERARKAAVDRYDRAQQGRELVDLVESLAARRA
jgi:colanic acid biosynthesis glycosyl transferase WcaI